MAVVEAAGAIMAVPTLWMKPRLRNPMDTGQHSDDCGQLMISA
jgi:hypothetical protein